MNGEDKKTMLLLEALQAGIVTSESYIDYTPDYQEITFDEDFSGWYNKQCFCTCMELGYNPFVIKKEENEVKAGVYLVADGFFGNKLKLEGEKGNYNGIMASKKCAELQSSKKFLGEGIELTKELWELMPEKLRYKADKDDEECILLATHCHLKGMINRDFYADGFYIALHGRLNKIYLCDSKGIDKYFIFHLLPIVKLPSDIMVVVNNPEKDGTSRDKALELVLNVE